MKFLLYHIKGTWIVCTHIATVKTNSAQKLHHNQIQKTGTIFLALYIFDRIHLLDQNVDVDLNCLWYSQNHMFLKHCNLC